MSDEGLRVAIGGGLEGFWGWRWGYGAAEGQSWVEPNTFLVFLMLTKSRSNLPPPGQFVSRGNSFPYLVGVHTMK